MGLLSPAVGDLLARVRRRWQLLLALKAGTAALVRLSVVLAALLVIGSLFGRSPAALASLAATAVLLALALVVRALWPLRKAPSDLQVARFVEEGHPDLDNRLVSAVDLASRTETDKRPRLSALLVADAEARAGLVDVRALLPSRRFRQAGLAALGALTVLGVLGLSGRRTIQQSGDALSYVLFPDRVALDVTPGDARVPVGSALTISARLVGNRAPVVARLERSDGDAWSAVDMPAGEGGSFQTTLDAVTDGFRYRVVVGPLTSKTFDVAVLRPPRVTRIDVEYSYPSGLGLSPRTDTDTGDIYAPAETQVRVRVHTDHETVAGELALGSGQAVPLAPTGQMVREAVFTVAKDDAYRVHVSDADGLRSGGDTEYFIRVLDDRPPEVRLVKPARDRSVTRLEEVDIQAEAQDDFGIDRLDLVYSVRGGSEKVVPLPLAARETAVTRAHTLFLEDLGVAPGDFVSYYVRARDVARGRRSSEARSDMFFLEVRPFEQEFSLAPSQAGGGGGGQGLEELVTAQKDVIVSTWKLDRRAQASKGAKSVEDIEAVARAQNALRVRAESVSASARASNMRDPKRRGGQPSAPRAGQTTPEEDAMTIAALAMGRAVTALTAHKTAEAVPAELEALDHLLKALGENKKRQISRQAGVGSGGSNRSAPDLSSLFDKELQRLQQTNYETPSNTEQRDERDAELLDRIRELAKRQDELLRREQDLVRDRNQLSAEELKRRLEMLTRDQAELRQKAEEAARQMSSQSQNGSRQQNGQRQQQGSQAQQGSQSGQPSGQAGQQSGQSGQQSSNQQAGSQGQQSSEPQGKNAESSSSGQQGGDQSARDRQMRNATEEMRGAVAELKRDDPRQALERGARALEALRALERQLREGAPDERRRAAGDLQLEARQLADAQRQVATQLGRASGGDARRRLAGEQDRLAERVQRLKQDLDREASSGGQEKGADRQLKDGLASAARELERQRLAERMRQSAEAMRASAESGKPEGGTAEGGKGEGGKGDRGASRTTAAGQPSGPAEQDATVRRTQDDVARALDRLANALSAAGQGRDGESQRLTDDLARARELREQMEATGAELQRLGEQAGDRGGRPGAKGGDSKGETPGSSSTSGSASGGAPNGGENAAAEIARLQEQYRRQLDESRALLERIGQGGRTEKRGGSGVTFESQGMVLSAPGTESFKQDFAKWEQLRKQATQALERAESSLAEQLKARDARDRLASSVDDTPPAAYADQVDRYFRALAKKVR